MPVEVLEPADVDRAVQLFRRDGFVVVGKVLDTDQTAFLRAGVLEVVDEILALDPDRGGNRGSKRYSFGGCSATRSMLHRAEWQMLVDLPAVTPIITAIFESSDYIVRAASGDFCLPGATEFQPLHSDMGDCVDAKKNPFSSFRDPSGALTTRDLPCPYLCANFLPFDQTDENGPTRQIPGTQNSREPIPSLADEPEWMRQSTVSPVPAGSVQIRDVRAWHGGTPNMSDQMRAIPNIEYYAPWFREPMVPGMSYDDHKSLSPHGQHITRFSVIDSSEELPSGYAVHQLPGSSKSPKSDRADEPSA